MKNNDVLLSGMLLADAVSEAVENYHSGKPVGEDVTVDGVEITVLDDWDVTGCTYDDKGPVDIYAPLILVKGENEPERLFMPEDIEGFTPVRGHEYHLKIRRFYLTHTPFYHQYELIEVIWDRLTENV